ncbi:VOC family protein [Xanthomonas campestris]|uniref:Glyoxalase n=1 Tax=Xanthomonas campestris pv. papavericola TaxID=487881 RepID=A0AAJ3CG08_XANCA|nr:glyoxalase [Xanthomonas campestris]MEC3889730.1 glyoxalase [Xanthomonas campestris pv. papavericola]
MRPILTLSLSAALLLSALTPVLAGAAAPVSVGPQYDTTHVYVAPNDVDAFVRSFTATFGGQSTRQVIATVTPTPSSTSSQLVQTPAGTVSLFGFHTPVPHPFGNERTGYLVTDMQQAVSAARAAGAEVLVAPFKDPIGMDAVIAWPGGVAMQLYWHDTAPHYAPLASIPENRVYVSPDRADAFVKAWLQFSHGKVLRDDRHTDAALIGRPGDTYRSIAISSGFGALQVLVTDGHLPYPYGHELTGYAVDDLEATLARATASGAKVLVPAVAGSGRHSAMVEFPGGYVAELHADAHS